jgi:hypothetical protein
MSMATKYGMMKRAEGGGCEGEGCRSPRCFAHGGLVDAETDDDGGEFGDLVGRIMAKRLSKGGMVANDTAPEAPFEENEFDLLVKDGGLEAGEEGSNEHGDDSLDDESDDFVSRVMKKRKDKNPRPA